MADTESNNEIKAENELTHELILASGYDDPKQTLQIITATRKYLERHFTSVHNNNNKKKKNKPLSYTQLRNILLEVKKEKSKIEPNFSLIIPKLAYMEAKLDDEQQKKLVAFIRELLEKSIQQNKEALFLKFIEMFVAYHKYYSSSKNQ